MASPSLLRSAAGRVLRRSFLQGPSPRSPRVFFSGVAGRIGPCKEEKRSQRSEQLQKKIACVLVPATAALYIFGPDKKEKSPAEEQSSM